MKPKSRQPGLAAVKSGLAYEQELGFSLKRKSTSTKGKTVSATLLTAMQSLAEQSQACTSSSRLDSSTTLKTFLIMLF